jgi:hypothetical protein
MVEYVIDSTGRTVYAKATRGGNETMNEKIETAFMEMPLWSPAVHGTVHVPIRLKQTVMVGAE